MYQVALQKSGFTEQLKYIASGNDREYHRREEAIQETNHLVQSPVISECKNRYR